MGNVFPQVAAIVRTYQNPHVLKQVESLLAMELSEVHVVVHKGEDKGSTAAWLQPAMRNPRVKVHEIERYSWALALNVGIAAIRIGNRAKDRKTRFVFPVSVEAKFTPSHVRTMICEFADDAVGIVGTSFEGRQSGNVVSLGRSYRHPRCTGLIVRLAALGAGFSPFDPRCDGYGGMEDIDVTLSMLVQTDHVYSMLDLKVPLIVGAHYNQAAKELREQAAMDRIIADWRACFDEGTPERSRIEEAIATMGLENT